MFLYYVNIRGIIARSKDFRVCCIYTSGGKVVTVSELLVESRDSEYLSTMVNKWKGAKRGIVKIDVILSSHSLFY